MIRLNQKELLFLEKKFNKNKIWHTIINQMIKDHSQKLSNEEADELRNLCLEQFDFCGFDENYELTEDGRQFETIIDKLFTG